MHYMTQETLQDAADLIREIANTEDHPYHAGDPEEIECLLAAAARVEAGEYPEDWVLDELTSRNIPILSDRDSRPW